MLRSVAPMTGREVKNDDARFWHLTDKPPAPEFVVYWTNNGQKAALGLDLSAAIDPSATLAVHCGTL